MGSYFLCRVYGAEVSPVVALSTAVCSFIKYPQCAGAFTRCLFFSLLGFCQDERLDKIQ